MFFIVISIGVVQNFRDFPKFPKKWETFSEKKNSGEISGKKNSGISEFPKIWENSGKISLNFLFFIKHALRSIVHVTKI